ncbi:MAG: GTP cyclohydrolase II [Deltaproteobacteria bacterium]|nr:GTP cyclohydrolase II [Deltaproteobacteria bacterium]
MTNLFSYVDRTVRERLEREGRLAAVDLTGRRAGEPGAGEPYLSVLGPIPLPRMVKGEERLLEWYPFVRRVELTSVCDAACGVPQGNGESFRELLQRTMAVNSALLYGDVGATKAPLVRIHSCCMTGDVFGSMRCECGPQLAVSFERIVEEGAGVVVYMSGHEGRGIGLWAKAVTYILQDGGQDTYEANTSLGLPEDSRDFTDAAVILRYLLKGKPIRLLTNNPLKKADLERGGQPVAETIPIVSGVSRHNRGYLAAKRGRGHTLPEL